MPFFRQLSSNEIVDIYQDKLGYIWIGTTNGLERYDGYQLQSFKSDYTHPDLLPSNIINAICDDGEHLWIGTREGISLYNHRTCRIESFPADALQGADINSLITDSQGNVWIGCRRGKVYRYHTTGQVLEEYALSHHAAINYVYEDLGGNIWIMTGGTGIFRYDVQTDAFVNYALPETNNSAFTMLQDREGNYWIGTWGEGLWRFTLHEDGSYSYAEHPVINSQSGEKEPIVFNLIQDNTLGYLWTLTYNKLYALKPDASGELVQIDIDNRVDTHKMYTKILKDKEGNLWLGSYDMPYTIYFDHATIDNHPLPQLKNDLGWDANIVSLCLDADDFIWINQDRYGLCLYNRQEDKLGYRLTDGKNFLFDSFVMVRSRFRKGIWAADRHSPQILRLTNRGMNIHISERIDLREFASNPGYIKELTEDEQGNLWILTYNQKLFLKPSGSSSILPTAEEFPPLNNLCTDQQGAVWATSAGKELFRLSLSGHHIQATASGHISICSETEEITHLCIDDKGALWLTTSLGRVYRSDEKKELFSDVPLNNTIDNSFILSILSDKECVWVVTNKQIIRYNIYPDTQTIYSTSDNNLSVNIFRLTAFCTDKAGGIYAGGHGGFVHIQADNPPSASPTPPHLTVTDIKVDNNSLFFAGTPAKGGYQNTTERVMLNAADKNIEIQFSPLQYPLNPKFRFAYKLEGADPDWIYLDEGKHTLFYNKLNKGTYRLWLKSTDGQNGWSKEHLLVSIEKQPAFYETWYAYLIYIVLAILLVIIISRLYLRRIKAKNTVRFREELTQAKLDYFTNISHELLTPLTVISCATDSLEKSAPEAQKQITMLHTNVDRLKRLLQQVLDFRKADMNRMRLKVGQGNITGFLTDICRNSFVPLAQRKNIQLHIDIDQEELQGYLDFDKVDKIIHNLLSNAIKYTPENKQIRISTSLKENGKQTLLVLKIEDEGMGIAPQELEQIFTRFYTNPSNKGVESNGIGLSLTQKLVSLHHGTIHAESLLNEGSCFTVELPINRESYTASELTADLANDAQPLPETTTTDTANKPIVLLVDDNVELLELMKDLFASSYQVLTATNGLQAWSVLKEQPVEVVVCDVMMPEMNGWELCRRIKADLRFSHIPVIMLTARHQMDDRVASYEAGADGYIAKPFSQEVLFARINNLVKSYQKRQTLFQKEDNLNLDCLEYPSADKHFLQSVIESIEKHLQDSEFDLEQLATDLNLSKSTLHRKIKAMTGLTPLDFVRNIKLKRACMMLEGKKLTISEVAYAIGYNNPKYFTRCFKEEFGVTPTEYQAKHA